MGIEAREIRIGATAYRVAQLPTSRGTALLVRIVKLLGPGVGSFVGGIGRSETAETDSAIALGIGDALHDLAARLNEAEVAGVLAEFAKQTTVIVSEEIELRLHDVYEDHFAGRYDELIAWARFCLEVNYQSFFGGKSGSAKPLAQLMKLLQALRSPNMSTGPSTASPAANATPQA